MTNLEKLIKIKDAAKMCRNAQKMYFKDRTRENLITSKEFESKLDRLISEYDDYQFIQKTTRRYENYTTFEK